MRKHTRSKSNAPRRIRKRLALRKNNCSWPFLAGGAPAGATRADEPALAAFTKLAEEMMRWEVDQLVGPKNQADEGRDRMRWDRSGYCVIAGQKIPL